MAMPVYSAASRTMRMASLSPALMARRRLPLRDGCCQRLVGSVAYYQKSRRVSRRRFANQTHELGFQFGIGGCVIHQPLCGQAVDRLRQLAAHQG